MRFLSTILGLIALIVLGLMCTRCHKPIIIDELVGGVGASMSAMALPDVGVSHPEDGRSIVLEGVVPDEATRRAAGEAALAVRGVVQVDNRLTIAVPPPPPEPEPEPEPPPPPPEPVKAAVDCQIAFNEALSNDTVHFDTDKASIQASSYPLLDGLVESARKCPEARIEIGGHADPRGPDVYNLDLSQRRVESVRDYLIEKGIDGERLDAVGYGETRPLTTDTSAAGLQSNRRVEFKVEGVN